MKDIVKLYIADMEVEFSEDLSIPFVYQLEDTNNPTIIKNSFTKTIKIIGSKQNNKIFGDIYNFDRTQMYDEEYMTGVYFNPSYRTPFKIYKNGDIIESGYMQLNSITINNHIINYDITLYGGIGDFFYNLMYNENNEPLTLADLTYGVLDDNNKLITPENEFDFKLNKEFVNKCWKRLDEKFINSTDGGTNRIYSNNKIEDFITFVPSLNGLYENFDNNKVLINTRDSEVFNKTTNTISGVTYSTYQGYAIGELNNEYTEWEMGSLVSYQQRPAIKMSKVIDACCNPENNGGYNVVLDEEFFNAGNPYYDKAYIALPTFNTLLEMQDGESTEEAECELTQELWVSGKTQSSLSDLMPLDNEFIQYGGNFIDTTNTPLSTKFDGYVDIQLTFEPTEDVTHTILFDSFNWYPMKNVSMERKAHIIVQLIATSLDGGTSDGDNMIAYSNIYCFGNKEGVRNTWQEYFPVSDAPITNVVGEWRYDETSKKYVFKNENGDNTFRLNIENIPRRNNWIYNIYITQVRNVSTAGFVNGLSTQISYQYNDVIDWVSGSYHLDVVEGKLTATSFDNSVVSNMPITKSNLLKTENTPADYLLGYTKLFGLMFTKDIGGKTIYIRQRNNFFIDEVVDWSDRIDYSKEYKINPIMFNNKFYAMSLDKADNFYLDKYTKQYNVEYGQKRINTNYNFNSDTKQLLENNVYQNAISVDDTSHYYRSFFNSDGVRVPAFSIDGFNYKLFNNSTNELKSENVDFSIDVNLKSTIPWNIHTGYDAMPKTSFYIKDGDKKTLSDISSCLLFYNGNKSLRDVEGNGINYWITDDNVAMAILNENKPCHIYTESPFDKENNFIAYPLDRIPQFTRYTFVGNNIVDSWDFAVPKEMFIKNATYQPQTTIYDRYWASFYEDQLNINTKMVSCYVNLKGVNVNSELLRRFYYFGGCYWLLNKVDNYDVNNIATTKCEFIRVKDKKNYTKQIGLKGTYLSASQTDFVVPYAAGSVSFILQSSEDWEMTNNGGNIYSVSPSSGTSGNTKVTIAYNKIDTSNAFTGYEEATSLVSFKHKRTPSEFPYYINIVQTPDPTKAVVLSGTIKDFNNGIIKNAQIQISDDNVSWYAGAYADDYTGEYKVYVPYGKRVNIDIVGNIGNGQETVLSTTGIYYTNSLRNFKVLIPN